MLPLSGRLQRRHVAALALGVMVLAGGAYRFTGSRLAQVTAPTACIRSYGPFFQSTASGGREESVSVFPDGTRFLKVTGPKTVSLFTVDELGVVTKAVDLSGEFESAAVVALSDTLAAVAYQEGGAAYYRLIRLNGVGGPTLDAPFKLTDVPVGFGPYVRFALDALSPNLFVLVTNIPEAEGPRTLRAIVGGTVASGTLRPMGPYARPPAESSQAIVDFDVAAIDVGNTNTETFVVAFRGANGAKFIRGTNNPIGVVFNDAYLMNLSPTATSLDVGSSFAYPRKAALSYTDNGSAYAGEIVLATAPTDFTEDFSPVRISQNGDVVTGVGVDWIDERFYVAAYGVRQVQNIARKGTYVRRGIAGSSAFGSELKATDAANPGSLTLSGIPGARGRILIAQASATAADTGLIASYCAGCVNGVSDVGEQCVSPTDTSGSGGGDAPLCDPRFCGNNDADPGEQCDDGNTVFGDGCDALCRLECSDDGDCPSGECAGGVCTNLCGNGIVEPPTCVMQGGGRFDCPAPTPGEVRMVNLPGDGHATGHASGDLNGDGKLDLVVAYYIGTDAQDGTSFTGTLQAYINKGNGQFDPKKSVGTFQWNRGGGQRGMDIVDVDKDGDGDVLVYDGSAQGIVVLRNNNMTFTRSTAVPGQFAFYLSHGDGNGDGDPELGVTGFTHGQSGVYGAGVYPGAAIASFGDPVNLGSSNGYDTLRFADMDNDGNEDVVRVGGSNIQPFGYGLYVHLSNGDGTFANPILMFQRGTNPNVLGMDVGDVDGDGNLDVALAEGGPVVTVVRGNGEGDSLGDHSVGFPFGVRFVALVDPTADGKLDVVSGPGQGTEGKNLWLAPGKGDGTFEAATRFLTVNPPPSGRPPFTWNRSYYYNYDLKSADYDGDGRKDLSVVHALSSDSATVILLRGSLDGCTEVPPVVICSQAEECDDGLQNGQPGRCTRQCTLCGNGVIDTVNNIAEQCDQGAQNGEPGSRCSLRCTEAVPPSQHLACVGVGQCALVDGAGPNDCTAANAATVCCDPADPACKHMECVGVGSCAVVQGPGQSDCTAANAATVCCDPSDEECRTTSCDLLTDSCTDVPGPGVPQCTLQPNSCPVSHLVCENRQCTTKPGPGENECGHSDDCMPERLGCIGKNQCGLVPADSDASACSIDTDCPCDPLDPLCEPKRLGCVNNACTLTTDPDAPFCATANDCTPCPASNPNCHEQCDILDQMCVAVPLGGCVNCNGRLKCVNQACTLVQEDGPNLCNSSAECTPSHHLACVGIGMCAVVDGPGDDQCLDGATDCTCLPSDPFCTHAACVDGSCTEVPGPGMPLCASNADCTPCPASNPNCHKQCKVLDMQCAASSLGGCPMRCEDERHLACENKQCVMKQGAGSNECASAADCQDEPAKHLACVGIGACAIVDGEGSDTCITGRDCTCLPSDPSCTHAACSNGACVEVPGPGMPLCASNADCTPCPASNPNCHQQCAAIEMQCVAAPLGSCDSAECAEPRHLACQNEQCTSVPGAGLNECGSKGDCLIPRHLACTGVGACSLVEGPGPDSCLTGEDCTCLPSDPTCTHAACVDGACAEVPGPGIPLCSSDDDCTPCPASNPNCHEQCSAVSMQCVGAPLGGCIAEDCAEERHLACRNEQCASVPGAGANECDAAEDCVVTLCGNGTLDAGEDCDEGANNRTTPPDDISAWYCKAPLCTRSECFDGGDNDRDNLPDALDAGCWLYDVPSTRANRPISFLGFLLAQATPPLKELDPLAFLAGKDDESCPAETVDRGSFCALTCEPGDICPGGEACPEDGVCPILCPNGAIDDNEDCDDGNLEDGDLCSNICRLNPCTGPNCPRCGDGVYQHEIGEQCDDGNGQDGDACTNNCRKRCDDDGDCEGKCDLVTQQCLPPVCGDGEANQEWERCDDGNIVNDDKCNNQCQPTCKGDADCESGKCDQPRQVCVPLCGNGTVDSQEQCDDGNAIDSDQCSNQCLLHCSDDSTCDCDEEAGVCRPLCGNGRVDVGEGCDDGNTDNADACSNRCQVRCRPGTLCPDNQACPQNGLCAVPGVCGDGIVNDASEQCDDGNKVDGDGCSNACTIRCEQNLECPSGLLCIGRECSECTNSLQCSDGFCVEGRCRQALPICGNGVVEPGEVCDDANGDDADGCTSSCLFPRDHACVASAQCQTKLCEGQVCTPCTSASQCGSGLRCAEGNCLFGGEQCGDGDVQAGEACDDANVNDQDQCTSACLLPFGRACTHATQCASTICSAGSCTPCRDDAECAGGLRCAIGLCLTDRQMSLIPNICGNGYIEEGEACDDGNGAYGDGCTPSCQVGNSPSRSEVAANVNVQLPFSPMANVGEVAGGSLHAGASGGLSDTGPATVAVMAAGAAAGTAWVRRKFGKKKR